MQVIIAEGPVLFDTVFATETSFHSFIPSCSLVLAGVAKEPSSVTIVDRTGREQVCRVQRARLLTVGQCVWEKDGLDRQDQGWPRR